MCAEGRGKFGQKVGRIMSVMCTNREDEQEERMAGFNPAGRYCPVRSPRAKLRRQLGEFSFYFVCIILAITVFVSLLLGIEWLKDHGHKLLSAGMVVTIVSALVAAFLTWAFE